MEAKVLELIDHHEIVRLLSEYCHGCDRGDARLMGSVYATDSWDDHGAMQAPGKAFAEMMTARILKVTDVLSHTLGQSFIQIDGDHASAETYFIAVQHRKDTDGTPLCEQLGGRYVDRLERSKGRWQIKHRIAVRDWSITLEVQKDNFAMTRLTAGTRDASDVGAALLGLAHRV